jgi:HK97 family phage major capsid protein
MQMNDSTLEAVKNGLSEVKNHLDKRVSDIEAKHSREMDELAQQLGHAPASAIRGHGADPLAKLANNEGIKSLASGHKVPVTIKLDGGVGLLVKNTIVGDVVGTSEDGYSVQPMRSPVLANDPRRMLSLLDFLPTIRVGASNTFEFNRLTGYTSTAGYQPNEGALKPEGSVPTDLVSANIATIANWTAASEQVLADVPALRQQVSSLLGYGVRSKLESELILGAGGAGQIGGFTDAGNFTAYTGAASDDTLADAVAKIEASMLAAGWMPNLIVVHPNDWRDARSERAESGAGLYVAGSWRDPAPPSIWSIPVIVNPAVSPGNILMMDTSQVAVLDRQGLTVELGRINDQFVRNVVSIRAELRAGLAVFSPGAVVYGDFEA